MPKVEYFELFLNLHIICAFRAAVRCLCRLIKTLRALNDLCGKKFFVCFLKELSLCPLCALW
jgi:hypothetical protein